MFPLSTRPAPPTSADAANQDKAELLSVGGDTRATSPVNSKVVLKAVGPATRNERYTNSVLDTVTSLPHQIPTTQNT